MKNDYRPLQFDTTYHLYNRGAHRCKIFFEERNYRYFLKRFAYFMEPVAKTYAYALMPNHFHFLVKIKSEEEIERNCPKYKKLNFEKQRIFVSKQFNRFGLSYTISMNKMYDKSGTFMQGKLKRKRVLDDSYFKHLLRYIHLNPQNHGMVADFREYPYTSYNSYLATQKSLLPREEIFDLFGGRKYFEMYHLNYAFARKSIFINEADLQWD